MPDEAGLPDGVWYVHFEPVNERAPGFYTEVHAGSRAAAASQAAALYGEDGYSRVFERLSDVPSGRGGLERVGPGWVHPSRVWDEITGAPVRGWAAQAADALRDALAVINDFHSECAPPGTAEECTHTSCVAASVARRLRRLVEGGA